LELITGKFLRHSKEFYEWRIQDRLGKIAKDPNRIEYYDDLTVAYEKTCQHGLALEWILKKEKLKPGLYETYANLGTFHILAGDFEQGLPYIDKALAININAHFGRERYQKWLVEYSLTRKKAGKISFPLQEETPFRRHPVGSFVEFLTQQLDVKQMSHEEVRKAIQGIFGMMRFANHENPFLLEALGDLLFDTYAEGSKDAKRLAAFAYLKASYGMQDLKAKDSYKKLAKKALELQSPGAGDLRQPM